MRQREIGDHKRLFAVRRAPVILPPRQFAGVGGKVFAGDMVMVADFRAPGASEVRLGLVCARAFAAIGPFVVDALCQEGRMQPVPVRSLIGMDRRRRMHAGFDRRD